MKLSLSIFALVSLFNHGQEDKFPKDFRIGEYSYVMTIKKGKNHDDGLDAVYFVVTRKGNKNNEISSHKASQRNGQNAIVGSYRINKKFIEFKEVYSQQSIDSMMKRYYPNKKGNLILTEYTEYKNGISNQIKL